MFRTHKNPLYIPNGSETIPLKYCHSKVDSILDRLLQFDLLQTPCNSGGACRQSLSFLGECAVDRTTLLELQSYNGLSNRLDAMQTPSCLRAG